MKTIYDPFSATPDPARPGQFLRTPFAGNIIPKNVMDQVGVNSATYWPMPNLPGTAVPGTSLYAPLNNVAATAVSSNPLQQITSKVDHNFSANKRGLYPLREPVQRCRIAKLLQQSGGHGLRPDDGPFAERALGYSQTFGSATVLDLRAGVNRFTAFRPSNGLGFKLTTLGLPKNLETYMQQGDVDEFPGLTAQGYSNLGNNNGPYYSSNQLNYNFSGSVLRVIGKHSLTVGGGASGLLPEFHSNESTADELCQRYDTGTRSARRLRDGGRWRGLDAARHRNQRQRRILRPPGQCEPLLRAVHPGRHQVEPQAHHQCRFPPGGGDRTTERYNQMAAIDPHVLNPISSQVTNPFTGQKPWNLYGGYVFAGNGQGTLGRRAIRDIEIKPSPRIGLAYSLNQKTVIRAGYGLFYGCPTTPRRGNSRVPHSRRRLHG